MINIVGNKQSRLLSRSMEDDDRSLTLSDERRWHGSIVIRVQDVLGDRRITHTLHLLVIWLSWPRPFFSMYGGIV